MIRILIKGLIFTLWFISGCSHGNDSSFTGSGTIEATEIIISAKTGGEMLRLSFLEGDRVEKDRVLAEIDVENLKLQKNVTAAGLSEVKWNEKIVQKDIETSSEVVKQASLMLASVQKTYGRTAHLLDEHAATQEQMDKAETERDLAVSRLSRREKPSLTALLRYRW